MQILINNNDEIIGYALIGGFENGIEIAEDNIPQGFFQNYKPQYYIYENETISINNNYQENYKEPIIETTPETTPTGNDSSLRNMFASMQIQIIQSNKIVSDLSQQNANLSQEIVKLNNEIEAIKGANKDEDAVSEI